MNEMRVRTIVTSKSRLKTKPYGLTTKPRGTKSEDDRPHVDQEIRREGVVNDGKAPDLLVHIETMALNDECF